jgi:hypothetical protein
MSKNKLKSLLILSAILFVPGAMVAATIVVLIRNNKKISAQEILRTLAIFSKNKNKDDKKDQA